MSDLKEMLLAIWVVLCYIPVFGWFLYEFIHVMEGQEVGIIQIACLFTTLLYAWVAYVAMEKIKNGKVN
jgi:hypothetical protein